MLARRYLDFAASTPIDPRAAEEAMRAFTMVGNPSSIHAEGRACRALVETARERVAALVGVPAASVVFTSGATEANALAVRGPFAVAHRARSAEARMSGRLAILIAPTEHSSVMDAVRVLEREHGAEVRLLPVDQDGVVRVDMVEPEMVADVAVVAVMLANNVTGVLQPVAELGALIAAERARRGPKGLPIAFVCDAVQAARTERVRPVDLGVDVLTLSSHKIYGPKGAGALIRRSGLELEPLVAGGGQEDGLRGGTENVPAIVGFGAAAEILSKEREKDAAQASMLREAFLKALETASAGRVRALNEAPAVPGIAYVAARAVPAGRQGLGEETVLRLDAQGFAVSAGSACDAGKRRISHVLAATKNAGLGGLRVSFGRSTDIGELEALADAIARLAR